MKLLALLLLLLFTACAGLENHDAEWNKAYLATPMGAVSE
jgi:hypothetical protein